MSVDFPKRTQFPEVVINGRYLTDLEANVIEVAIDDLIQFLTDAKQGHWVSGDVDMFELSVEKLFLAHQIKEQLEK